MNRLLSRSLAKAIAVPVSAAIVSVVAAAPAIAEDLTLTLVNATDATLMELFISPVTSTTWERSFFDNETLEPEGRSTVVVPELVTPSGERICNYDIRGEFADGNFLEAYDVNLCEMTEYVFERSTPSASEAPADSSDEPSPEALPAMPTR